MLEKEVILSLWLLWIQIVTSHIQVKGWFLMEVIFYVYTRHDLLAFSGLVSRLDHDRQCQLIAFDQVPVSHSKIS